MPQPPTVSSSPEPPEGAKPDVAARPASKRAPAKPRASSAKAPAKKPAAKPAATKATAARATATKSATAKKTSGASTKPKPAKAAAPKAARKPAAQAASAGAAESAESQAGAAPRGGAEPTGKSKPRIEIHLNADAKQLEAIAERVRKLNERIIELGREAGEGRLASYEKTLKTIANGISQGPGKDELEWITQLASSQAKFVREITDSWAKAARDRFR